MLALAPVLLAAALSSGSANDPPPCAAANVPGCLPGYVARTDRYGRLIYVQDPNYYAPQPAPRPAPRTYAQPAQPAYTQQPQPANWAYPTSVAPRRAPEPLLQEDRGHVALVFTPGVSSFPRYTNINEIRFRLAGEYTSFGKIGEASFKYDFLDGFFFRPFLAIGIGVASINPDADLRAAGSASLGVDLYLGRNFFLTGELKERMFMEGTNGAAHGLITSDRRQTALLAGMGFYFF